MVERVEGAKGLGRAGTVACLQPHPSGPLPHLLPTHFLPPGTQVIRGCLLEGAGPPPAPGRALIGQVSHHVTWSLAQEKHRT